MLAKYSLEGCLKYDYCLHYEWHLTWQFLIPKTINPKNRRDTFYWVSIINLETWSQAFYISIVWTMIKVHLQGENNFLSVTFKECKPWFNAKNFFILQIQWLRNDNILICLSKYPTRKTKSMMDMFNNMDCNCNWCFILF